MRSLGAVGALLGVFAMACAHGTAASVTEDERVCGADDDCALITLACCPCGNGDGTDSVNRRFAARHAYKCTESELKSCAMAGACAQVAKPLPVCRGGKCAVETKAVAR